MAIAQNYPNIVPSLSLDFANVKALDPRITFTRASTATYYGTETAKAEENLLRFSQEFDNAGWGKLNTTITANTAVAPDGTTTAETMTATASTGPHLVSQSHASQIAIVSVFAKAGTHSFMQITGSQSAGFFANFDLTLGTVGTVGVTTNTATITDVGNGWYRCTANFFVSADTAKSFCLVSSTSAVRQESWTATGTETVFLWGAQLEQRDAATAYTPTTTQPITNFIPVLESAASGVARFDHNPVTKESLGLLIEEQRTNLLLRSEEFDNAGWGKTNATVTANTVIAPSGELTGDKLVENTASGQHLVQRVIALSNASHVFSVYAKAAERSFIQLRGVNSAAQNVTAFFDLSTGTVDNVVAGTADIQFVGNGWYRCSLIIGAANTSAFEYQIKVALNKTTIFYTGDGFSGIFIWGAQLEAGSFPTSYIPTSASQVTRAADAASMTGANFSSWYNAAEGTLFAEAYRVTNANVIGVSDGGSANRIQVGLGFGNQFLYFVAGSNQALFSGPPSTLNAFNKIAFAFKTDDFAGTVNAGTPSTDTSGNITGNLNRLHIGSRTGVAEFLNAHIRKISYYPVRVTNAQLQGLTS